MELTNKSAELYVKLLVGLTMPGYVNARNKLFSFCRLDFTQKISRELRNVAIRYIINIRILHCLK